MKEYDNMLAAKKVSLEPFLNLIAFPHLRLAKMSLLLFSVQTLQVPLIFGKWN
jgi:hypothetical protein